jgi:hypothetical protein
VAAILWRRSSLPLPPTFVVLGSVGSSYLYL